MKIRLADFIRAERESILQDWDDFAKTIQSGNDLSSTELRDHAEQMLLEIADDLESSQSQAQQAAKSKGRGPTKGGPETPAREHGVERYDTGFSMLETVSEFRALRASVLSHWTKACPTTSGEKVEDMMRFNEAIDQSLVESLQEYAHLKEKDTRLLDVLLAASPDPIFVLDIEGNVCFANKATADLFNLDPDEITGKYIFSFGCSFESDFKRNLEKVITEQSTCRGRFLYGPDSGQQIQFEYQLAPVVDKKRHIEATVCVSRDITQEALAKEEIWHSAHHDDLTGLPNRRLFMDRLEQEVKHAKRNNLSLSVLFMDLDGFKEVNDSFGHEAGDHLLRTVARRLIGCVREEDTIARMGGDEFTVILTGVDQPKNAKLIAKSIIDALAMPFEIEQRSVYVSASIGISLYLKDASSPDELIKAADDAMYKAKEANSSVYVAS